MLVSVIVVGLPPVVGLSLVYLMTNFVSQLLGPDLHNKVQHFFIVSVFVLASECIQLDKMANATKDYVGTENTNLVSLHLSLQWLCVRLRLCLRICDFVCVCVFMCLSPGYHRNEAALGRAVAD